MNIVCVAACTAGIAHTYIAREKLIKGAKALGHNIKVETQGTIGTENELAAEDIAAADVVILAVDVKIKGEERFKNKRIVRVKTEVVIKSPIQFIEKVEKSLANA
ncbi:PTS fructose transporter subunit IIB [Izhakiella australiensis]|uniref:protein-N(pi)-phosphohistidine--D-fructose phosphotransferase n=1 Tax=Izhakiella australiensis TaxID=1926881 RepID=A0A1S8YSL6_9GAMM|nr:fructose PTS transporter subunit IIB [Izhakiella australiensis]OON42139.1 PTS fructose transporter subunit IIB [Izhakiella australiensis]